MSTQSDAVTMVEALERSDAKGNSTNYKKRDLAYDLGSWLKIEIEDTDTISEARETSNSLFNHTTAHCAALEVLLAQPSLLEGMLDAATKDDRTAAEEGLEASCTTEGATSGANIHASMGKRVSPRWSFMAWNHGWQTEMRRGLTDANEQTFDISKFNFEEAYFRQGFTAAMLALGVRGEGEYNDLSLRYDARAFMAMHRQPPSQELICG